MLGGLWGSGREGVKEGYGQDTLYLYVNSQPKKLKLKGFISPFCLFCLPFYIPGREDS